MMQVVVETARSDEWSSAERRKEVAYLRTPPVLQPQRVLSSAPTPIPLSSAHLTFKRSIP